MLALGVPCGALFYGAIRRREEVSFDAGLRAETEALASRLHILIDGGVTPPAVHDKRCEKCSLVDVCLPGSAGSRQSACRYLDRMLTEGSGP